MDWSMVKWLMNHQEEAGQAPKVLSLEIIPLEVDLVKEVYGESPLRKLWPEVLGLYDLRHAVFGVSPELLGLAKENAGIYRAEMPQPSE